MSDHRHPLITRRSLFALAGGALVLAACGGDDSGAGASNGSAASQATTGGSSGGTKGEYQAVTVTGTALPAQPDSGADDAIGMTAPSLSGFNFDGEPVAVTPGKDGKLMVVFVAHWCPHCQKEVPLLVEWIDTDRAPKDVRIVAVSTSASNQRPNFPPSKWLAKEKWPADVMADNDATDAAAAYGLTGFPYFVLVNSDGTVAKRSSGEVSAGDITVWLNNDVT